MFTFLLAIVLKYALGPPPPPRPGADTTHTANPSSGPPASGSAGKIAVTTKSEEARKEFLAGRDLAEKLRITDSVQHFDKAIALDPEFALAQLNRANSSPTRRAKEFFDHLKQAVALSTKASDGEQMLIARCARQARMATCPSKKRHSKSWLPRIRMTSALTSRSAITTSDAGYPQAITHYKRATELAPDYSTAFNILGYAYRQNEDYGNAETAFKKYVELIPKDPNPYDSYAELLLKMGRFDE